MPAEQFVLAIDLGTSGPKVGLVSTSGTVAAWSFEPSPLIRLPDGGVEQDPDDWWRAVRAATERVVDQGMVASRDIVAVGVTSQWSGTVPVAGSRHIGNALIWMDSRGSAEIARVNGGPVSIAGYAVPKLIRWIRRSGGAPGHSGKDPVAHILYLKHHQPDVHEAATVFLEPKDYLNLRLTGVAAAGYDSITLHWVTDNRDLGRVRYDPDLIRLTGLDLAKLPALRPPDDVLAPLSAEAAAELGLLAGIPVMMGTPDTHSAGIGAGAIRDFQGHLYLGTSSWISCHVPFKKTDVLHGIAALPAAIPGRYFAANEQENAGSCLTYLVDNLGMQGDPAADTAYQGLDRVAERVPAGANGVIFTPWLNGERSPVDDHYLRAGFFNQSLATTDADLIRAVFEGVAFNARWLLGYVEKFTGHPMSDLRAVGGGANSAVWCQIHADVLDRTILQVKDPILAGLRGVAFLAAAKLGSLEYDDIPGLVEIADTYQPNPEHRRLYDDLYREFRQLHKANRKIHVRLNRVE
ncbi:MAG: FGGY-family carbohydrate kinase [Acidimicrobiia bacterium]|nr:FGGY-family carbohydrate kinase [Acidimicrobiia bacterium]